ncbi:methane/phenol/toluene hydroxylase [Streptomyces sp. TLI_235]|nr:hypothetical protein [Streptomyces sp. TLI_235]PBC77063.1 methane/phenol/toluene hydroxylase [Streptomyces sp. TLI_235]
MQYELRYRVLEPRRQTYQNVIDRLGDQPASRYLEATLDVEPRENFHYRPTWAQGRELYDERFSALRLSDPYSYTDPRQYYYTPYVTQRAALHDEFGKTLGYLETRDLLSKLPEPWHSVLTSVVVPLRHYESGAQLVSVSGARFAYGTSLEQCCTFAAFDRIGNAQMLSRIGIAAGGQGVTGGREPGAHRGERAARPAWHRRYGPGADPRVRKTLSFAAPGVPHLGTTDWATPGTGRNLALAARQGGPSRQA